MKKLLFLLLFFQIGCTHSAHDIATSDEDSYVENDVVHDKINKFPFYTEQKSSAE